MQPNCFSGLTSLRVGISLVALAAAALAQPEPGIGTLYVGYQNQPTFPTGTYAGQSNPNHNRLTLLFSHTFINNPTTNHFHRIGAYVLTGPAGSPTQALSTNNRIPEPYQLDDGLALLPGSGVFSGRMVSGLGPTQLPDDHIEQEYGNISLQPINNLFQYDNQPGTSSPFHPGHYLLNSGAGSYKSTMENVTVGLELTGISAGLSIHDSSGASLFSTIGDRVTLGPSANWAFTPIFAVDGVAPLGETFSATFRLVDLSPTPVLGDSGDFSFDFVVAPEPASLTALAGLALLKLRRRK